MDHESRSDSRSQHSVKARPPLQLAQIAKLHQVTCSWKMQAALTCAAVREAHGDGKKALLLSLSDGSSLDLPRGLEHRSKVLQNIIDTQGDPCRAIPVCLGRESVQSWLSYVQSTGKRSDRGEDVHGRLADILQVRAHAPPVSPVLHHRIR